MKETIQARLLNDLSFEVDVDGHKLYLDTALEHGGKNLGPRPKLLMMVALAGCTAMDVISILRKKRQDVTGFEVKLDAKQADEHPHIFTDIHVKYIVRGRNLKPQAIERAIELSETRYCPAHAMLSKAATVDHSYEIVEEA